jgi:hypothetical protein
VPTTAKYLTDWLQGIRNNLKALFSLKVDKNGTDRLMTVVEGTKLAIIPDTRIYKGENNVSGTLIVLGDIAQGNEIIFNLLYNETTAGNLVIHAIISGQFYTTDGSINRTGLVQYGNKSVSVYAFYRANIGYCLWIPQQATANYPSARAEVSYRKEGGQLFQPVTAAISTSVSAPTETLTTIVNNTGWVDQSYTLATGMTIGGGGGYVSVKRNDSLGMIAIKYNYLSLATFTFGMRIMTIPSFTGISVQYATAGDVDLANNSGRYPITLGIKSNGDVNLYVIHPTKFSGAAPEFDGCNMFGSFLVTLQ